MTQTQISSIDIQSLKGSLHKEFYEGLAEIAYYLNLNGELHSKVFADAYMMFIYKNVSTKISEIMVNTGYSYHSVSKFINRIKSGELSTNQNRTTDLVTAFLFKLRAACNSSADKSIPKYGKNSLRSIFEESNINNNFFTLPSVLNFLKKCQIVRESENRIYLNTVDNIGTRNSPDDAKRQFSKLVKHFVTTKLQNMNSTKSTGDLVEQITISGDIPDNRVDEVVELINQKLRKTYQEIHKELENFETFGDEGSDDDTKKSHIIGFCLFAIKTTKQRENQ